MTVIAAVAVLVGVLASATILGVVLRSRTGRARPTNAPTGRAGGRPPQHTDDLAPVDAFGSAATLVQFSTPTCARCPATRRQLDAVADSTAGVTRIEIDLAERPELARRFDIMQTPAVLLLDGDRAVRTRFGGPPRPAELSAALDTVLTPGTEESR